ncbi:hypothetical protein VTH06DRAFT_3572 [Thermothelomyces fergusii]
MTRDKRLSHDNIKEGAIANGEAVMGAKKSAGNRTSGSSFCGPSFGGLGFLVSSSTGELLGNSFLTEHAMAFKKGQGGGKGNENWHLMP